MTYDLAIVGGGPAGASAAIEAAARGLKTVLIDEQRQAGGQVWRAKSPAIKHANRTPESMQGDQLRSDLAATPVECQMSARVWHMEQTGNGFNIFVSGQDGASKLNSRTLLLAGGAQERIFPLPGWTLPGVIGLGAATALMKEQLMLPGQRVVVAGTGPLLYFVAHEIIRYGGTVAAVVDQNSFVDWLKCLPDLMSRPDLLTRGVWWRARLRMKGVKLLQGYGIRSIHGDTYAKHVEIGKVASDWLPVGEITHTFETDAVCLGHGLTPASDASRLMNAAHHYDERQGGWIPTCDDFGRTTTGGVFAVGDGAGVQGAAAAQFRGRLAAIAIALDLGKMSSTDAVECAAPLFQRLKNARRFGLAMTALSIPKEGILEAITADTLVCRCEGLTRAEIEAEIRDGGDMPNALKSGTRCGMGPCGGRYCLETAAELSSHLTGKSRAELGLPTARPPLRPVSIGALSSDFDYEDLPIPAPSPL